MTPFSGPLAKSRWPQYSGLVILAGEAYERWRADETWNALARMSPSESLTLGMTLWTSAVAAAVVIVPEARHQNVARQLGISDGRLEAGRAPRRP